MTLQEEWERAKRQFALPLAITMLGDRLAAALDLAENKVFILEQERDLWRTRAQQ